MTLIIDRLQSRGRTIGREGALLFVLRLCPAVKRHFLYAFAVLVQNEGIGTHKAQHHVGQNERDDKQRSNYFFHGNKIVSQ